MQVSLYSTSRWASGSAFAKHNPRTRDSPWCHHCCFPFSLIVKRGDEILYPPALPGRPWALLYLAYGGRAPADVHVHVAAVRPVAVTVTDTRVRAVAIVATGVEQALYPIPYVIYFLVLAIHPPSILPISFTCSLHCLYFLKSIYFSRYERRTYFLSLSISTSSSCKVVFL